MTPAIPGHDEITLTHPDSPVPCNSLACVRAGRHADVVVTFGILNDPGTCLYARQALWRESWGTSVPMCAACWDHTRQVAAKYRPRLTIRDMTKPDLAPPARP